MRSDSDGEHDAKMARFFILSGSALAMLGVLMGAFGAHVLRARLSEQSIATFQTAVHYHLIHALGLILVGIVVQVYGDSMWARCAGLLLLTGIVLFSGSLYGLALTQYRWLGPLTPLGGVAFLLGWLALAVAAARFAD